MKLHLPVKLRASLIAAVIAVSASVYNAYGAHTYKSEFGSNQFEFSSSTTGVNGNDYIVETFNSYSWTDSASVTHEIAKNEAGTWCKVVRDASGAFVQLGDAITETVDENTLTVDETSKGSIIFNITDDADTANFEGNTTLQADNISFNNNLVTVDGGANGRTDIKTETLTIGQSGADPVTEVKTSVALENVDIEASSTILGAKDRLTINNSSTAAADTAVSLGAVSGTGSLTVNGSSKDDQWVAMDSVDLDNKGSLELGTIGATVGGDVHVNDLILTNNQTIVNGGDVTIAGKVEVTDKSSLTASGDILSNPLGDGTGSANIAGTVTSTGGDIFLDNGTITGSVTASADQTTSPDKGDITLKNIAVSDGATINASGDLTLTGNSTITDTPNDNGTPDDTTDDNGGISVNVGGNLTVDDSDISGTDMTVEGDVTVQNGSEITGGSIDNADNITVSGAGSSVTDTTITDASGKVTVSDGASISGGSIAGAEGDGLDGIEVSGNGSSIDGTTITGNEGNITVENGGALTNSTIDGGEHLLLDGTSGADLTGTTVTNIKGDIKIANTTQDGIKLSTQGTSTDNGYDAIPGGSILISDSTLSNATIKSGVQVAADGSESAVTGASGAISVTKSKLTQVELSTKSGNVTISGTTVTYPAEGATDGSYLAPPPDGGKAGATAVTIKSLTDIGVDAAATRISSITVLETSSGSSQTNENAKVKVTLLKGGEVVATSNVTTLKGTTHKDKATFTFAEPVDIDPSAEYTLKFYKEDGTAHTMRLALTEKADGPTKTDNTGVANWNAVVMADYLIDPSSDNTIENSVISTEVGSVTIDKTVLLGATVTTENGTLSMTNTYTTASTGEGAKDTVLEATGNSTITNSMLDGGTDVTISGGTLTISGSKLLDDVNLNASSNITIEGGTTVDIDGGEAHDASIVTNGNLVMTGEGAVAGNEANIENADVQVAGFTTIYKDGTLNLTDVYKKGEGDAKEASKLGFVKADDENGTRGTLNIESSKIEISGIRAGGNDDTTHFTGANTDSIGRYFGTVNVSGESDVKVTQGKSLIANLNVEGTSTVSLKGAYLDNTTIDGTSTVETVGISKMDDVNIADGGTIRVTETGDGVTTLANLNQDPETAGTVTVEVVNGTLETPVVNERVVLGLSGGTLELKTVAAEGTALAASTAAVSEHVVLAGVTNAGVDNLEPGTSTIKTAGLNRLESYASTNAGTNVTLNGTRYLYTVAENFTATAADNLWMKNTAGEWELITADTALTAGAEVSKIDYSAVGGETQYDGTPGVLIGIVDADPTLSAALLDKVVPNTVTDPNAEVVEIPGIGDGKPIYQLVEKETIEVTASFAHNPGAAPAVNDGIASLTVKGDFGANQTEINAYRLAEPVLYWKDGAAMTIDQYNALSDADKALCTPEYKESAKVYWTIADNQVDSSYTKLNPLTYTATGTSNLTETDYNNLVAGMNQTWAADLLAGVEAAYVPAYIKTDGTTITPAAYEALSDAEKALYTAGYTNTVTETVDGATLTDTTGWTDNGDGTYSRTTINEVTITTEGYGELSATGNTAFAEDERYFTTITEEEYNALADKNGWTEQEIGSLRDGESYGSIFIDKFFGHLDPDKGELIKSDDTGYIQIGGDLTGSNNTLNADTTINVVGSITGSGNKLTTGIEDAEGNLLSGESITVGGISGSGNTLNTISSITTGAITGANNTLTAGTTVTVNGGIVGTETNGADGNTITAGTSITTGAITGSTNTLTAETGAVNTGAITGSTNELTAGTYVNVEGKLDGSGNTLTSHGINPDNQSGIRIVNGLKGDGNTLVSDEGRTVLGVGDGTSLNGNGNTVLSKGANAAGVAIRLDGKLQGNNNTLTAETGAIETGEIDNADDATGYQVTGENKGNTLSAATKLSTGAINGDSNTLTADGATVAGDGATLTTGNITGDYNHLTAANGDIKTGEITGDENTLTASASITSGNINGDNNVLTSSEDGVQTGSIRGMGNTLTADTTVTVNGALMADNSVIQAGTSVNITQGIVANNNDPTDLKADGNTITATTGSITIGAFQGKSIQGDNNTLTAGTYVTTGAITGSTNTLTAETGAVTTGAITGDANALTSSGGKVHTKSVAGSYNTLSSGASFVQIDGTLKGSHNTLTGADGNTWGNTVVITGGIQAVDADTTSDYNEITAEDGNITISATSGVALEGSHNKLDAKTGKVSLEGVLKGNSNELTAGTTITVNGKLDGDGNTLTAENGDVDLNAQNCSLEGDGNTITATGGDVNIKDDVVGDSNIISGENILSYVNGGTDVWASLVGDSNELTASNAILMNTIEGDSNKLTANGATVDGDGATLTTGDITGDYNHLTAANGDIKTGAINGTDNVLSAKEVWVNGTLQGSSNEVTGETIDITTLSGSDQEIVSTGVDNAADTAIHIETMDATNSTIQVAFPNKGSIDIDALNTQGVAGETATSVSISTHAGNVNIDSLNTTAKTSISVGSDYGITVGSGSASNQTWVGGSLSITGDDGLTLTDSTVNLVGEGSLTGTSLTIKGDTTVKGVTATLDTLTLDGTDAVVDVTKLTVNELLELKGGATMGSHQIKTDDDGATLKVTNSTLTYGMLDGFTGVALDNSTANLAGSALGTADKPMTGGVTAENKSSLTAGSIYTTTGSKDEDTTADVVANDSKIVISGDITAEDMHITDGGSITAADVTLFGVLNAAGGKLTAASVTGATNATLNGAKIEGALSMDANSTTANVTATNGTTIGSIANADAVTLTGSKVTGNVGMNGALQMSESSIGGDVTGATNATLMGNSTIGGSLTATGKVTATGGSIGSIAAATDVTTNGTTVGDVTMTGALNATGGEIDSVSGATDVTTNGTTVGDVTMTGALNATDGTIASVSGANGAELKSTDITGELNVTGGTVAADGGSIDSITGAATVVDLDGTTVGTIDMATTGDLIVKDTTTGAVNAADGNTVANATLTNATIGSGLNVTNNMTTTGNVTVGGDVTVGNNLSVNTGTLTADNVTVHGTTTLTGGTVDVAGTFDSTTMELVNIDGEMAELKAGNGLSLSGADVKITGTDVDADVNVAAGGMSLTGGASVTNAGGASIKGGLTVDESAFYNTDAVAVTGKTEVSNWGVLTGASLTTDGLEVDDNGEVTLTGAMDLNNGGLTATDGAEVTATGITEAGAVMVSGASTVRADTVTGATTVGVTNGGTLVGSVTASDAVTVENDGTITGNVANATTVTVSGENTSIKGSVTDATGLVTVTGGDIIGNVTTEGGVTVSGAEASIGGTVDADGDVTVTDGDIIGKVTTKGDVTVSGAEASIGGTVKVEADGAVAVTGGTVGEVSVSKDADVTVTVTDGGAIKAGVRNASKVTVTDARIDGGVANASGTVKVTNGTIADGVSTTGDAVLDDATIEGYLAAANTTVTDTVKVGSAVVAGLTVNKAATLTADAAETPDGAAVTANGALDIKGDVVAKTGNISLTGTGNDSAITAAKVTAHDGDVVLAGTVAATDAVLSGTNVTINGTLNAGKGVSFAGQVGGTGTINKTGGDTLVMADGASIGTLNVVGSTLDIAGEGTMGRLTVNGGTIDGRSTVLADVKLGQRMTSDTIVANGRVTVGEGAVLELNDMGTIEANVADQHRETIIDGNVSGSFEVKHGYETLNVHTEGGDLVFSKNYKGAQNKTENQSATADALAAILDDATGELANVKDALANTRSEADALAALDSLSGAGLAAAPKLIADETKEHLQTLRNTIQSVSAGLMRRYDENGVRHAEIESTGVTAAVTGGSATVDADGNAEEYTRDSIGAMFTVAHAINDEWTFGAALSFSQADADCGSTTIESQGVFLDVGVMQKRGRFSQMGSIGCAFFSMDTERNVSVNAPGHGFGGTAEGSMDAMAFTMTYETSYAIWQTESYSLSSVVMAEMLFAQVDNMEEDGLGNASLRSSFDDVAAFTFGVGARYTYHFGEVSNPGYFSAEAMFVADTGDSTTKVNNAFIGGGNSFELSGPDAGNYGLRLNAGVLLPIGDQWGIFGNVTSEIRSEQTTVGGSVGVKCTF